MAGPGYQRLQREINIKRERVEQLEELLGVKEKAEAK